MHLAAQATTAQQDKWLIIDAMYAQLEDLQTPALPDVLPRIWALMEAYPELDYSGPGRCAA